MAKLISEWHFKARFRRHAFGWRSQPAVERVKQAVSEIKKAARTDAVLGAEGAVTFLERVSPVLEQVDSSSGAIGAAVRHAINEMAPIIAAAPVAAVVRDAWLERLWEAHGQDQIPYIESLADRWGELCASRETASAWADRLVGLVELAWSPAPELRGYFHGAPACLSALFAAGRFEELLDLLQRDRVRFWPYQQWGAKALVAMGKRAEAIKLAQACGRTGDRSIAAFCEELLLSSGLADEAYERYALTANRRETNLATYRALARRYPRKRAATLLADLVASTPGEEGKWFATAKEAGLFDEALVLASRSPCDPKTLARAARDFAEAQSAFAVEAGLLALKWLVAGYGYEVSSADVWAAYDNAIKAAAHTGRADEIKVRKRYFRGGPAQLVKRGAHVILDLSGGDEDPDEERFAGSQPRLAHAASGRSSARRLARGVPCVARRRSGRRVGRS